MFSTQINRRQFLTAGRNQAVSPLRPPWSINEADFQDACTRCGDCLSACPENILIREGVNGYPIVDFKRGECTFCTDCVKACPSTALAESDARPWLLKAVVGKSCLAKQQVICTTCAEQCELRAIRFTPLAGAIAQPEINLDVCTGCGACDAPCPAQAIEMLRSEVRDVQ
ncbi:MAG: ferredoxin-type protein NapF [Mariprofundus sp.]|nr:ferredoxin-type protein NapF [Mariprofundus sp.]